MRHILGPHARSTGRGRWRRLAAVVVPALSLAVIARGDVDAAQTTALAVQVPTPARAVYGGDGREHVDYDLVITNAFTAEVTLKSLTVTSAGKRLLELTGEALAADASDHRRRAVGADPRFLDGGDAGGRGVAFLRRAALAPAPV